MPEITVLFSNDGEYFVARKGDGLPQIHVNLASKKWIDAETEEGGQLVAGKQPNELLLVCDETLVYRLFTATSAGGKPYARLYPPAQARQAAAPTRLC